MKRIDILLAMGNPALLSVTEEALLKEGLTVRSVTNGIDAVTSALSLKPRCILCGQILAGLDGIKVSRFLSTVYTREEMPVIISVPDINPRIRSRVFSASAVEVVDYSTPFSEVIRLIRLHISQLRESDMSAALSLSRDRIMLMVADSLEDSLEVIETVISLSSDLSGVNSVSEACRKVVLSILGGLGFQRAWIGLLNESGTTVEAAAFRGRGLTGEPIHLSGNTLHSPVDMAVAAGIQVASWSLEYRDNR